MFKSRSRAQHSAAEALADANRLIAAVHRSQAVIEFDLNGCVREANDNFLAVVDYRLEDIQGRHHRMFMDPAEAASKDYSDFWRRLNAGEYIADKFVRYGRDGRRIVIEASYNPILNDEGKPCRIVKFATDVTRTEEEREQHAERDRKAAAVQGAVVEATRRGLSAMAAGDLTYRIQEPFPGDYATLRDDFNQAMAALDKAMGVIGANAAAMQSGVHEINSAAEDLSRRTERQAVALEQTAAALDQITATVRKTAENAQAADSVVVETLAQAETGGAVVRSAVEAMGEIERSSDQIGQIISVIDEIAFQTNLLALNAGVEAARAGDAGRGFAVVASEVRSLAQRSADSARQIKTLISASADQVKTGVRLVRQSGDALIGISDGVGAVTALMTEIRGSTQEQSIGLAEVNTAVNNMDHVTQQNAAMVEQTTAASLSLSRDAAELRRLVQHFHVSEEGAESPSALPLQQARAEIETLTARMAPAASSAPDPRMIMNGDWESF